ncbi:MAG: cupin domain-containing protein [Beijerinckiaceae bacterium]|jgi:gentisate 1,2-dioxygenase|nr:cupin domain-containing protein [Beijerinckiaceae bacterium]
MTAVTANDYDQAASMDELYALLGKQGIENGWNKPEPSLWPLPNRDFVPAHWAYREAKAALNAAGRFVNTELAERRNLILANPIEGNTYPTVRTLVCAYQMVKAGETAKSHRHTANALRLVLDTGENTFTIVDGKKIPMVAGDVLLTPNWSWHAHANESNEHAYWMDFLDVPTVHLLGPMFFEHHPDGIEKADEIAADTPMRFPFEQTAKRLEAAREFQPGCRIIELGAPAMATISLKVIRMDAGAVCSFEPSTLSTIYSPMQGTGTVTMEDASFHWSRGDSMAGPSAYPQRWEATEQSYLLQVSDEPLLSRLDWLKPVPART